ncbi:hypothetical protein BpHYR1_026498 [Brachionus plicatilis]|uniref:Protein sleepless n=1 Tax=Brachionus plicatilis TaxID=10195 RepID=A0A3M7PAW4_BRAPC|nr:hypothetical protein BpHYR1_026498 [Brachionus plicatilis]
MKSQVLTFALIFCFLIQNALSQFLGFGANIIMCWRCEDSECNRYFDFTQHTAEQCDGKCWKSYEIIEAKTKEEREQAVETPASRRCFTSDELMKANAIGINTANGCRDIKMREKVKHFCFCDSDMCNTSTKLFPKASFVYMIGFILFYF